MPDFGRWTGGGGDPSLNEINRADRFIEALSSTQPVYSTDPAEAELAFLLSDWRDEVREAPVAAPVTARDVAAALDGAMSRRRSRGSLALVGSVAAAMLCVGGFGAAVYGSGPGDSLYGMRSSLFGTSQATRDDQVSLASAQLQQVQQLIDQGQWQQAQDKLVEVSAAVQDVDAVESKQDLVEQWNALTYKVVEQNPAATLPPGEPLPVLPSSPLTWLPVPAVEATSSSESSSATVTTDTTTTGSSSTSSPSATSVPSEVLLTPPPDGSTGSSTTPSAQSPSPSSTETSTPSVTPTTTVPPSSATTTAPAPASTTTTTTTTTSTTARPVQVPPSPSGAESPAPSQPRVAANSPKPQAPVNESAAPVAPVVPIVPKAPSASPTPQQGLGDTGGSDGDAATTTTPPPR